MTNIEFSEVVEDLFITMVAFLLFLGMFLIFSSRSERGRKQKAIALGGINFIIIGVIYLALDLYFDNFYLHYPQSESLLTILTGVPLVGMSIWFFAFLSINLTDRIKKIAIFGISSWYCLLFLLYIIEFSLLTEIFQGGAFVIALVVGTSLIHLILNTDKIYNRKNICLLLSSPTNLKILSFGLLVVTGLPLIIVPFRDFFGLMSYFILNLTIIVTCILVAVVFLNEYNLNQSLLNREYQAIVENSEVGILKINSENDIVFLNKKADLLLKIGTNHDNLKWVNDSVQEADKETLRDFFNQIQRGGNSNPNYTTFQIKGTQKEPNWIFLKAGERYEPNLRTIYFWDISREKHFASVLEKFIAVTSHELRTPLTIVRGYVEFLQQNRDISDNEKQTILQNTNKNIIRLERLVHDVHDLSKITAGSFTIHKQSISVDLVWQEYKSQIQMLYPNRIIHSNIRTSDMSKKVDIDLYRFNQIIFNLLSNAVKHSNKDSVIEVDFIIENNLFRVNVTDYGEGVPDMVIFQIGKPFIFHESKLSVSGSGLGFYIIKSIIDAHGGKLLIFTQEDFGTTISIQFPITKNTTTQELI